MKSNELLDLISKKDWSAIAKYPPSVVVKTLNFEECMSLAYDLYFENFENCTDGFLQEYSVNLFFFISQAYSKEWDLDWKNDVFLGNLCSDYRFEDMYLCYKRAYDKFKDPPAELLRLLSSCNSAPGTPPISKQEAEEYLLRSVEKEITFETAISMRALYRNKKDKKKEKYWDKMCDKLEKENIHSEAVIPDIFKDAKS